MIERNSPHPLAVPFPTVLQGLLIDGVTQLCGWDKAWFVRNCIGRLVQKIIGVVPLSTAERCHDIFRVGRHVGTERVCVDRFPEVPERATGAWGGAFGARRP